MQPERNFQGVSCAPGSAQQGRSVQNVSFTFGNHAQRGDRALEGSEDGFDEREGEDAAVWRGVILRRKRVMRKMTRMRKRVMRRCGVRCRKPCLRWGMKITTRPLFAQGLKRRDPLHHHDPGQRCGLRMCFGISVPFCIMCTTPSVSSEDFQW